MKTNPKLLFQLVLISTFLLISSSMYAQDSIPTRIGIKGGLNLSTLYAENVDDTKMLTGFNLGLFAKLPLSDHFAIQPELYYTTKGAEVKYNNAFVDGTARFNLNYIELPILLVVSITDFVNFHVGPYAAYLISGKAKNESNINLFDFEENLDTDDYNKFDLGIAAGVGLDFKAISLGLRYNHGTTKIGKEETFLGTTYTFPDAKNGVLSLYLSLSLN